MLAFSTPKAKSSKWFCTALLLFHWKGLFSIKVIMGCYFCSWLQAERTAFAPSPLSRVHFLGWNCQVHTRDPRVVQVCMLGAAPCFLLRANSNPFPDIRSPFLRWFIQEIPPAHDVLGIVVRTGNHVGFRFCWKRTQTQPLTSLLDGCQWLPTAYSHRQTP